MNGRTRDGLQVIKSFKLSSLNKTQKGGLSLFLIAMVALLFLHNPFGGYTILHEDTRTTPEQKTGICSKDEIQEETYLALFGNQTYDEYIQASGVAMPYEVSEKNKVIWQKDRIARGKQLHSKCFNDIQNSKTRILSFGEWSSSSPTVDWFGSIAHFLAILSALVISLFIWLFINKEQAT